MKKIRKLKDELSTKDSKRKPKIAKKKVKLKPYSEKYSTKFIRYISEEE